MYSFINLLYILIFRGVECFIVFASGDSFLVPGATVATLLMLGVLHARRMYDDKKVINYRRIIKIILTERRKAAFMRSS